MSIWLDRWICGGALCLASTILIWVAPQSAGADPIDVVPESPDVFVDTLTSPPLDSLGANVAVGGFDFDLVLENWVAVVFPTEIDGSAGYDSGLGDSGIRLDLDLAEIRQSPGAEGLVIRFDASVGNSTGTVPFPLVEPATPGNNSIFPDSFGGTSLELGFTLADDVTNQVLGALVFDVQLDLLIGGDTFGLGLPIIVNTLSVPGIAGYQVEIPVDLAFDASAPPTESVMSIVVGAQFLPIPEPGTATLMLMGLTLLGFSRPRPSAARSRIES